jgi:gamma-glutamyl-gamma-aminobutyrate hydrolase PuuD
VVASGFSEPDGLVEAIEVSGRRFALGVLWHCEEDERSALFGALIGAVS